MSNYIKSFLKFTSNKNKMNEAVIIRDDEYIVGGITIKQSFINSYVNKVKKETEKNLRQIFSDQEIAEQLIKFLIDEHASSVDDISSTALLGTQPEIENNFSSEETELEVEEDEIINQDKETGEEETEEEETEEEETEEEETEEEKAEEEETEEEETEEDQDGFEEV